MLPPPHRILIAQILLYCTQCICSESILFAKFIDLFEKFCGVCQVLNQILNKNTMAETTEKVAYAICFHCIIIFDVVHEKHDRPTIWY